MKKKKTFRSKLEEQVAALLDQLKVPYEYETAKVAYTIMHHYNPDFILPNGIYLESKGYWDAKDRRKILAVVKDNPDIDLRMVFQAPFNKISKKSRTTYAQWCERHGIKWAAVHAIPIDWLI
jgi:predicted nuclease of restriction endonuclease-like RecB superfamily